MASIVVSVFSILVIGMWFWALLDIFRSRFQDQWVHSIWLIVVLFFPFIGSIMYFQLKRRYIVKRRLKFKPNFNR